MMYFDYPNESLTPWKDKSSNEYIVTGKKYEAFAADVFWVTDDFLAVPLKKSKTSFAIVRVCDG
jgi:hypothetical protein